MGPDGKNTLEATCIIGWYPANDSSLAPLDSEIPYLRVRQEAPALLVNYFEKHMIIRNTQ